MSSTGNTVGWKEVRNQELSEVIVRRQQARLLPVELLDAIRQQAENFLPPGDGERVSEVARILEKWLDLSVHTPNRLQETVQRWQKLGLLSARLAFTLEDAQHVLQALPLVTLREVLLPRTLEEDAATLSMKDREDLEAQWRKSGWLRPGLETPLTLPLGPFRTTLDERARATLRAKVIEYKVSLVREALVGWVPLSSKEAPPPLDTAAEDREHLAYQATADKEWRGGVTALALDALLLEALLRQAVSNDLIGLALSGGGIRSASFNLGVLQAVHDAGLLRHIDYLSTVSGGGYVGCLLSSLIHERDVHLDPAQMKELPLGPSSQGKQPERVVKLVRGGSFLNNPYLHLSRYLTGLLLNNLVLLSALLCVCTSFALAWRALDTHPTAEILRHYSGGFVRDWNRPFVPALIVLFIWFAVSAGYLWLRGPTGQPRFAHGLLYASGALFLVGAAVWLATPNLDMPLLTTRTPDTRLELVSLGHHPAWILLLVAFVGLIPFLKPQTFLASGVSSQSSKLRRVTFQILSVALLGGIPFALTYLMARHGIAATLDPTYRDRAKSDDKEATDLAVSTRRWKLHETDIHHERWVAFWSRAKHQATNDSETFAVGPEFWKRLECVHENIEKTLEGATRTAIEALPVPLDFEVRAIKQVILDEVNTRILADSSFIEAVLGRPPDVRLEMVEYVRKRGQRMQEARRLQSLLDRYEQRRLLEEDYRHLTRLFLEAYYGWAVWERSIIRRSVVAGRDQVFRGWVAALSGGLALLASMIVGLNATSLHGIYRNQLARVYLEPVGEPKPDLPLHQLDTTSKGGPYHLISGTLDKGKEQRDDARRTAHFLFSRRFCGSLFTGYVPTEEYLNGNLDLATAMAISGAAFSPVRQENQFIAFLMLVLNLRLGQWMPSPRYPKLVGRLPMLRLMTDLLFFRGVEKRRYWFVTDGGHSENLGLGPLLRRECKLMVVSDAGYDPDYGFDDFVRLYRHARIQGVRFKTLDQSGFIRLDPLVPDEKTHRSQHRYVVARVEYPGGEDKWGLLVYIKPSFAGDEGVDLMRYQRLNPEFPHDPTVNQWFDEDQVESYRELGAWIGKRVCQAIRGLGETATADRFDRFIEALAERTDRKANGAESAPEMVAKTTELLG